jgi:hypothetical protein
MSPAKPKVLTPAKINGWKNYGVAVLCILAGLWALKHGDYDGFVKGSLAGLIVISLRDVLGKLLSAIHANCESLKDLRAAIETELSRQEGSRNK